MIPAWSVVLGSRTTPSDEAGRSPANNKAGPDAYSSHSFRGSRHAVVAAVARVVPQATSRPDGRTYDVAADRTAPVRACGERPRGGLQRRPPVPGCRAAATIAYRASRRGPRAFWPQYRASDRVGRPRG